VGGRASNILQEVGERDDQARLDETAAADRERVEAANKLNRDRSMIEAGRRVGGLAGAMVAGAMIAVRDVVEGPQKDQGSVVVDAPTEPEDLDADGTTLPADEVGGVQDIAVPAQPRRAPITPRRRSRRGRP
jgi:hypothetical protein